MSPEKQAATAVAVASIHEEDFGLADLSVPELEKLKVRIQNELTARKSKQAGFSKFEFEAPDDRSYGSLVFTANTSHGVLHYESHVGHNYFDNVKITLDGQDSDLDLDIDEGEFGSSTGLEEAEEACAEAVAAWAAEYEGP